ncbi:MAG: multidrug effflux MFS transporter [Gammaproteobacteria bacterium]|nr:multidrug effflux MFS transporter [Gammaproteobacteria bacterium]
MALMISLVALSIDAMLPALGQIATDLGVRNANDRQLVISVLFLGLAFGQLIYGPVSDSVGRKPPIYVGFVIFMLGCVISIFAATFTTMLVGRFLQGVGAAGPRIVTIALVRDQYEGNDMAKIMSLIMAVFILVPAIAPSIGQGILLVAHWRVIFVVFFALAVIALLWFAARQPETLSARKRRPFSLSQLSSAVYETCTNRIAICYTIAAGLIFGAFVGYLTTAQQIFQEQYDLGKQFPLYFAVLALVIGAASYVNSHYVKRYGMKRLSWMALTFLTAVSLFFVFFAYVYSGYPPLWLLMAYLCLIFFAVGILFGNFNAMAMEPLGHIAGLAAAVIATFTTLISLLFGVVIGQAYNQTVMPLVIGFAVLGVLSVGVFLIAEKGKV